LSFPQLFGFGEEISSTREGIFWIGKYPPAVKIDLLGIRKNLRMGRITTGAAYACH
jgi:hypothetical protein